MHHLVITRAHFECGPLIAPCTITFTTSDGGELVWKGMVGPKAEPQAVTVPGKGQLFIEHDQMCSVSLCHKEHLVRTSKVVFEEVRLTTKAIVACGKCGKKCSRTKVFSQTLNPFNTNADGSVKTRQQIQAELEPLAVQWRSGPIYHVKCED